MKRGKFLNSLLLALSLFPYAQSFDTAVKVTAQSIQSDTEIDQEDANTEEVSSADESSNGELTKEDSETTNETEDDETSSQQVQETVNQDNETTVADTSESETDTNKTEEETTSSDKSEESNKEATKAEESKSSKKKSTNAKGTCSTVDISTMDSDLNSGEETQIRGEISVNPDSAADGLSSGDRWSTVTIQLSDNLKPTDPLSFPSETLLSPNTLAEAYNASTNTLTFNIADYYALNVGVVQQLSFYTEFIGASDLDKGKIDIIATSLNGEKCEKSMELTYHDPLVWSIDKSRISPSGEFIVAGSEITYQIKANASGTAEATVPISLIDKLPAGVEIIDVDGGTVNGNEITWDLTQEEKDSHSATRTVTVKITDPDAFPVGTKIVNTAEIKEDGKVVDTDKVTDTVSESLIIDPGNVQKNAHAGETGYSGAIEPGGEIYWTFDGLDIAGMGELDNYKVVDEFPADVLKLDAIDFGSYKAPNNLVSVQIIYTDASGKEPLTINSPASGGTYELTGDQGDDVKEVVYSFGKVTLPFVVTSPKPGVHTTVVDNLPIDPATGETITSVDNKAHFEYDVIIPDDYTGEPGDLCPSPFSPVINNDKVTCTAEGGDEIEVSKTPAIAGIKKDITSSGPYFEGDEVKYKVVIHNNKKSEETLTIPQLVDLLPSNEEYVPGSLVITDQNGTTSKQDFVVKGNKLTLDFSTPMIVEQGKTISFTYTTKINDKISGSSINKVYAYTTDEVTSNGDGHIVTEPGDLNENGSTEHVMFDDASHEVNPVKVNIDKTIEGFNREFLPETVKGSDGNGVKGSNEVPYKITFTNDADSGDIVNPTFTDTLPNVLTYIDKSFSTESPIPGVITVSGKENDNGSAQKLQFKYTGTLHPGESITITFKAHVNDYAQYGKFTNNVSFNKSSSVIYDAGSTFTDKIDATISGVAGQAINKKVNKDVIEAGEAVIYTVTVANTGTYNLGNLVLNDNIPRSDDGRHDPDTTTEATGLVDTKLISVPMVLLDGERIEGVTYSVSYLEGGELKDEVVDETRLEQIQVLYGAGSIRKLSINLNSFVLHPGEFIQLKYEVDTPNDAIDGAEFYNNASIKSDILNETGATIKDINSTSSMTENIIEEADPTKYKIGDFVWYDYNHNGKYESNESPVQGATVYIYTDSKYDGVFDESSAKLLDQSLTDSDGIYLFPNLAEGDYKVILSPGNLIANFVDKPKDGYKLSTKSTTDFPTTDSTTGNRGKNYHLDADFALEPAVIRGNYFYDLNGNGTMDTDEHVITKETPGVEDSKLSLTLQLKINGSYVDVLTKNTTNGAYEFNRLPSGTYRVKALYTADGKPYIYSTSKDIEVGLDPGEISENNNFGLIEPAEIKGDIWEDANMDKKYNDNLLVKGVRVNLFKGASTTPYKTFVTGADGHYDFPDLLPGDYRVEFGSLYNTKYVNKGDSNFTDGKTETISAKPKDIITKNGGLYYLAAINGFYYEDMDYNMRKNSIDVNLNKYTVTLLDASGNALTTATTDPSGYYQFTGLEPLTDYKIQFSKDTKQEFIDSSKTFDTKIDASGRISIASSQLKPKTTLSNQNASVVTKVTIKGNAFEDVDGNDQNDRGVVDRFISNVGVTLKMGNGDELSATTDASGNYVFEGLYPGTYIVTIEDVNNMERVNQDVGSDANDSDVNSYSGISDPVTLYSHDADYIIDAGYYAPVDLGGVAYEDRNLNSTYDSGETLLSNVNADLYYKGSKINSTTTDADGKYEFTDLKPGEYQVRFTNNLGMYPTDKGTANTRYDSDIDTKGVTNTVLVKSQANNFVSFDAGYFIPASIDGIAFYERDPSNDLHAKYDPEDTLLKNITMNLIDLSTGSVIKTATTNNDGFYKFSNLKPGNYQVVSDGYPGAEFLIVDGGTDQTGKTDPLNLAYGQVMTDVDTALFADELQVGDFVFEDKNMNGMQDDDEPGVKNVKVEIKDMNGNLVDTTTTNESGQYILKVPEPDDYVVQFEVPEGYKVTKVNAGTEDIDSDANSAGFAGRFHVIKYNFNIDMGLVKLSNVSGTVYRDKDENGNYTENPDLEKDGQKVELVNQYGITVKTQNTDSNGYFEFEDVVPGDYTIKYNQVPIGGWTPENDGGLDVSSDKQTATRSITVPYGEDLTKQDAGYENRGKISGYAYEDSDGLGTYEFLKDRKLSGVKVDLYEDEATTPMASTTTDRNGYYEFSVESAKPNEYHVEFEMPSGFDGVSLNKANSTKLDNDTGTNLKTDKKSLPDGATNEVDFDAAFYQSISLGGNAYHDIDYDGKFTDVDEKYSELRVNLYRNGVKVGNTTTDTNGNYEFTGLKPGDYHVQFIPLRGEGASDLGTPNTELDNDANLDNTTEAKVLNSGMSNYVSFDGAYIKLGKVSGTIFYENGPILGKYAEYDEKEDITINAVKVSLYDENHTLVETVLTSRNGDYSFEGLRPGNYTISVTSVPKYKYLTVRGAIQANRTTGSFEVPYDGNVTDIDGGLFAEKLNIGDFVWEDSNLNGIQDNGEKGISGVTVDLYNQANKKVGTTTTDSNGFYGFEIADPGTYRIQVIKPEGYAYTTDNVGEDEKFDSDVLSTGHSKPEIISANNPNIDAGLVDLSSLSGYIYRDVNYNGKYDLGIDIPKEDYEVSLEGEDFTGQTTRTDKNGYYEFKDLMPKHYTVKVKDAPAGLWTKEADRKLFINDDGTAKRDVNLGYNEDKKNENAGYAREAKISGYAYDDYNANGKYDADKDIFLPNVEVSLYQKGVSRPIDTKQTDENGYYRFMVDPADENEYRVEFKMPDGFDSVSTKLANSQEYDNDIDNTLYTNYVTVKVDDENKVDFDGAFYKKAQLSGHVYEDYSHNGKKEATEQAIAGQKVELLLAGKVIQSTTTDTQGYYEFKNLNPSKYQVRIDTNGYNVSQLGVENTKYDNDIKTNGLSTPIYLGSKDNNQVSNDGALYITRKIGGITYNDHNIDGKFSKKDEVLKGINVNLYLDGKKVDSTTTDKNGAYSFTIDKRGQYVVTFEVADKHVSVLGTRATAKDNDTLSNFKTNKKYIDLTRDDFENFDGAFYNPINLGGTTYRDKDYNGQFTEGDELFPDVKVELYLDDVKVNETSTDENGKYEFKDITPGTYHVKFVCNDGSVVSVLGKTNTALDNDTKQSFETSKVAVNNDYSDYVNNDGAFILEGSISGTIFYETNPIRTKYAHYNVDEDTPMDNVQVKLYDESGKVVASTKTRLNGEYRFTNLRPGNYTVKADPVAGLKYLIVNNGIKANASSDNIVLKYDEDRVKVDGGLFAQTLVLGNRVWDDSNMNGIQDEGESGIADVTINLYNKFNEKVASTTTDENGFYAFNVEDSGDYHLEIVKPDGYAYTMKDAGDNERNDSDADLEGKTEVFTLKANNFDEDFGLINLSSISGYVYRDVNHNGQYDLGIDLPENNHEVRLMSSERKVISTNTNKEGYYEFKDLNQGNYQVLFDQAPLGKWTKELDRGLLIKNDNTSLRDVKLAYNTDVKDQNAGFADEAIIEGHTFNDYNADGIYNPEEDVVIPHVEVYLYQKGITEPVGQTRTDSDGYYKFSIDPIDQKDYQVKFAMPTGFDKVSTKVADSKEYNNDIDESLMTNFVTVKLHDENKVDFDGAFYQSPKLSGYVYNDYNQDGKKADTEKAIGNQNVKLLVDNKQVAETTTDETGYYEFANLAPNNYQVKVDSNNYYISQLGIENTAYDNDIDQDGKSKIYYLGSLDNNKVDYDAALYQTALIGGVAYNDHNTNGKRNAEDEYLSGIKVNLFLNGKVVASTTTDKNGTYQFEVDKNGKYNVEFEVKNMNVSQLGTKNTLKDNDTYTDFKTKAVLVNVGENNFVDFDGAFNEFIPLSPTVPSEPVTPTNPVVPNEPVTPTNPVIPTIPSNKVVDTDGDGLSDDVETKHGFNPYHKDTDNDGISDYDEFMNSKGNVVDKITNNVIVNTGIKYASGLIASLLFALVILFGLRRKQN